jgi:hypothetical protein
VFEEIAEEFIKEHTVSEVLRNDKPIVRIYQLKNELRLQVCNWLNHKVIVLLDVAIDGLA